MNEDQDFNSCDVPQEVQSHESKCTTTDSILNHLLGVVNVRTKKTPLVKSWVNVDQSADAAPELDQNDSSKKRKGVDQSLAKSKQFCKRPRGTASMAHAANADFRKLWE